MSSQQGQNTLIERLGQQPEQPRTGVEIDSRQQGFLQIGDRDEQFIEERLRRRLADHRANGLAAQHVGKVGYLQLGFAQGGVIFLYETATEWYDLFQELMDSVSELGHLLLDDRDEE